jgi:hypothetical protein
MGIDERTNKPCVSAERTGIRDLAFSNRHRQYGWDLPCLDIDHLMIEYDNGQPLGLIEYKHEFSKEEEFNNRSYQALKILGLKAGIPVFGCKYSKDFSEYEVFPLTEKAKEWFPCRIKITEQEWVEFLYRLRGREIPKGLFVNGRLVGGCKIHRASLN